MKHFVIAEGRWTYVCSVDSGYALVTKVGEVICASESSLMMTLRRDRRVQDATRERRELDGEDCMEMMMKAKWEESRVMLTCFSRRQALSTCILTTTGHDNAITIVARSDEDFVRRGAGCLCRLKCRMDMHAPLRRGSGIS